MENCSIFFHFLIADNCFINAVLASALQWKGSAICIHLSPNSWTSFLLPPTHPQIVTGEHWTKEHFVLYKTFPLAIYMVLYISPSWITALLWWRALHNSMKLWAMPCRATQDGLVIVKSSEKTRSTGGRNGNQLQYSCHENPMNIMKAKRYVTGR